MAVQFGHVGECEEGRKEWQYPECLRHFLTAKQRGWETSHVSVCDWPQGVQVVWKPDRTSQTRQTRQTGKPGKQSYKEEMTQHHNTPPSDIIQRYKFHTQQRQLGDNYKVCVRVAQTCRYEMTLEAMIWDCLHAAWTMTSFSIDYCWKQSWTLRKLCSWSWE